MQLLFKMTNDKLKAKIRKEVLSKHNKETKINYLKGMNLFNDEALREMDIEQINELVDNAMQVKGF